MKRKIVKKCPLKIIANQRSKASRAYYNTTLTSMSPFVRRGTFSDKSDNISIFIFDSKPFWDIKNKFNYLGKFGEIIKLLAKHTDTHENF